MQLTIAGAWGAVPWKSNVSESPRFVMAIRIG